MIFFFKINIFKKKDLKTRHRLDNLDDDESLSLKDGSSSFKQDDVDSVISSSVVSNPKIKKTQAIYPIKSASSKINLLDNSSRPRRGNNGIATLNFHLCILVYLFIFNFQMTLIINSKIHCFLLSIELQNASINLLSGVLIKRK